VSAADPVRYVLVGIEQTDQHALEQKALQDARSSATGVLAAGLAHEIRNPLNGASLHLSVLQRDLARLRGVSSSTHDAVAIVRSELRRLSSLVTDFLEMTRPRPLARAQVDIRDIVRGALIHVEQDAKNKAIGLSADLPPHPLVAWVDAERLKKALLNLLQNALEAVARQGTVRVRARISGGRLELEVEDDGHGIADAGAPIFDPFFTTKRTGTGLGLSIVQRTVTDHGGEVSYTSVPKRTVFHLRLPVSAETS
jgi:signal transduction histidine kinase